jgi:hypothetical protein
MVLQLQPPFRYQDNTLETIKYRNIKALTLNYEILNIIDHHERIDNT